MRNDILSCRTTTFFKFFGLLESEFEDLISRNNTDANFSDKMRKYYNGYMYKNSRLYNIWSVVNALHQNIIENFFSQKDLIIKITPVLQDYDMEETMRMLLCGKIVSYVDSLATCLLAKDLAAVALYCNGNAGNMKIDKFILLKILFQHGYVTNIQDEGLIIPNIAILNTLRNLYYSYFQQSPYQINLSILKKCLFD